MEVVHNSKGRFPLHSSMFIVGTLLIAFYITYRLVSSFSPASFL